MCGITGIIGSHPENRSTMALMLEAQKHRGPDAMELWQGESVTFGHNRLSIIDLSSEANQPFISNCGNYIMVFNGEIYNYIELKKQLPDYAFRTHSDTEVLLAGFIKWGKGVLEKLNGMFSFAIWDKSNKTLFAARDRFGVKPFYYSLYNGQVYFSSEIKTLFAAGIPKERNNKTWANYFSYGTYGVPEETFWKNIRQLPGGHYFSISSDDPATIIPVKWYDFEGRIKNTAVPEPADFMVQYEELLHDAISLRFRADVPLGMNVSGGLDSSLLIALVHRNLSSEKNIEAFTFYSDDARYDELPWVQELMKTTPYPLNKVLLKWQDIPELISEVSFFEDEPFGGFPTLAYSLLFKEARRRNIPVILDGQGMDEAWAGYDYYHNDSGNVIQGLASSPVRPEVLIPEFASFAEKENHPKPFGNRLQDLQYRDLFYTKIPRALRFNDRISMRHGIELREPFLDYRLVEMAFAQPDSFKMRDGQTKWMLRELAAKYLGSNIALAPKRPVQTPQREWISNELKDYFEQQVKIFSKMYYVNPAEVQKIWEDYCRGNQDNSFYIWQWINAVSIATGK